MHHLLQQLEETRSKNNEPLENRHGDAVFPKKGTTPQARVRLRKEKMASCHQGKLALKREHGRKSIDATQMNKTVHRTVLE